MMKHIHSILRTLCLVAMLCLSSANASAYDVIPSYCNNILNDMWSGNNILVANNKDYYIRTLDIPYGKALIIAPNSTVTVANDFINIGTIYVFGSLKILGGAQNQGFGTIYVMEGGWWGDENNRYKKSDFGTTKVVEGKAPMWEEDGWKDYYEYDIPCGTDFYPMYFSDADLKNFIPDLDAWKKGEGRIFSGIKKAVLAEINSAMEGVVFFSRYKTDIGDFITKIENATSVSDIENYRYRALEIINDQKTYNKVLSEIYGDLFTEQNGNMIEITGPNGETIKLYNPKSVTFKKSKVE